MAMIETSLPSLLTRKQAAEYIRKNHFPISAASLARYAKDDDGPKFCHMAGREKGKAAYAPEDLDAWVRSWRERG